MPVCTSSSSFSWRHPAGCVLAGFYRAADANMAKLVLTDRGHEMAGVYRCTDLLCIYAGSAQSGVGAAQAFEPVAEGCECHWLLIPVDVDDVAIVGEYLQACGAERTNYCKFCSKEAVRQARSDIVRRMCRPRVVVMDERGRQGVAVAEFHPLSWSAWTGSFAGAVNG